jgi:hypothetical protein
MFVEVVHAPAAEIEQVFEASRLTSDPPPGLMAAIAYTESNGESAALLVWETPGQRGDWAADRMVPLYESGALADASGHPERVEPIEVWIGPRATG